MERKKKEEITTGGKKEYRKVHNGKRGDYDNVYEQSMLN